jgi:predicted TIM-barrel fold metal-dependent hydrolase
MIIDAAAHPVSPTGEEIRTYMSGPWRSKFFPGPERYQYASPFGQYRADAAPSTGLPGSDPELFERQLLDAAGIEQVVLLPLTRGLLPNTDLASAVCAATNDWLADVWLDSGSRFLGTIRINPADPDAAIAEIQRWADHPKMVQVAVPLQAPHPYGQRGYFPIWKAASDRSLPVAIHVDGGASIDFHPSSAGPLRYALEYDTLTPLNAAFHLASFIAEGVFERLPGLRIVFADGGLSALTPIVWRLDKDWRGTREEIPWTTKLPSEYIKEHVRFCLHEADSPRAPGGPADWWEIGDAKELLMYSSNYPQRDCIMPRDAVAGLDDETAERVLCTNASELYSLNAH